MKPHTKIYLKAFGHDLSNPNQFIASEWSGRKAVDIHHIISRGRGGTDRIENLMALTRMEHHDYGDKNRYVWTLLSVHRQSLKDAKIEFDNEYFEEMMSKYALINEG